MNGYRVFKACGPFPASLSQVVARCQELSLVRLTEIKDGALRRALERVRLHFTHSSLHPQPTCSL